jgi:hypothetical protein
MDPLLIPIAGMSIPLILVPTILVLRHARLERELEHAERIKALELGRTLPQDEPWWTPARICVAIGAGVPIGVFGLAFLAGQTMHDAEPAWIAAGMVGVAGVLCGTFLAGRYITHSSPSKWVVDLGQTKPDVEADAFDVVSSRGGSYQTQSQMQRA